MIPEASREVLKQWQAKGLKFNVTGVAVKFTVEFTDSGKNIYTISEQPIPKGMSVEAVEAMWWQGLMLEFDTRFDGIWVNIVEAFNWHGAAHQLLKRLRIPAQPIPEKLLQEPVTELPAKKCVIGQESDPNGLNPHAPGASHGTKTPCCGIGSRSKKGNAQDPKTGLLHQAHLAWNALAVLELMLKETK